LTLDLDRPSSAKFILHRSDKRCQTIANHSLIDAKVRTCEHSPEFDAFNEENGKKTEDTQ